MCFWKKPQKAGGSGHLSRERLRIKQLSRFIFGFSNHECVLLKKNLFSKSSLWHYDVNKLKIDLYSDDLLLMILHIV